MKIYDFDLNLLCAVPDVISTKLVKYYNKIGNFQCQIPLTSPAVSVVMENDFLIAENDGEFAIITGKELDNCLTLYGRTPNWLLSKRVILPFDSCEKTTVNFVRDIFTDSYKNIRNMAFSSENMGETYTFIGENPTFLSQTVFDALEKDSLGCEMKIDIKDKKFIFNVFSGEEKSLIISEANKNASGTKVTHNISELANFCYHINGDNVTEVGDLRDTLTRFETYVRSKNTEDCGAKLNEGEKSIDAVTCGLMYKRDYNLGDIIRVQIVKNDYRVTKKMRISGVEISHSAQCYGEKPIFEAVN